MGKPLDTRTDLFSFGVTLYEMATGQMPFHGDTTGILFLAIVQDNPVAPMQLNPRIPEELQRIINKCLEKDRDLRYQHASDISSDLKRLGRDSRSPSIGSSSGAVVADEKVGNVAAKETTPSPDSTFGQEEPARTTATTPGRRSWKVSASTLALVIALAVAGVLYWRSHRTARLTDKDTIVVADFINTTGDSVFDGTLRQGLAAQIEQSPFLSMVSDDQVAKTLTRMERPKDARITHQLAREVCQRAGGKAAIEGSISGLGSPYRLELNAVDCQGGDMLVGMKQTAESREQVLPVLSGMAAKMRQKLGESLASVQKYDVPVENVTTGSLEALQAYSQGVRTNSTTGDCKTAIQQFERAISFDPNFAMAYAKLSSCYNNLGETVPAAENARKSYELRQRVSQRERFRIEYSYEYFDIQNLEAAARVLEAWMQAYPRDDAAPYNLANVYSLMGDHEKALALKQQSLRLTPDDPTSYWGLIDAYIALNRLDEAQATIKEAQARNLDSPTLHSRLYTLAFLQHDNDSMARETAFLISQPWWPPSALYAESETAAYGGQISKAQELLNRAVGELKGSSTAQVAAAYRAQAAVDEVLPGNLAAARQKADEAMALSDDKHVQAASAVALALCGHRPTAIANL